MLELLSSSGFLFLGDDLGVVAVTSPFARRANVLFQRFFTALSVLPGRRLAISAHLFPFNRCSSIIISSSSWLHGFLLMSGLRWLYQRSLHCLPSLPLS